jgi:hypothetical protein
MYNNVNILWQAGPTPMSVVAREQYDKGNKIGLLAGYLD